MSRTLTDRDLILAILALDSYNRGYNAGVDLNLMQGADTGATIQIGEAMIGSGSACVMERREGANS